MNVLGWYDSFEPEYYYSFYAEETQDGEESNNMQMF
jgi:hypothetical protein